MPQLQVEALDSPELSQVLSSQKTGDANTRARFYSDKKEVFFRSQEEKKPVFKTVDMVEIIIPGHQFPVTFEANENHKKRFPQAWTDYQSKTNTARKGTPLENIHQLSKEQIALCAAYNVQYIEDLAGLTDDAVARLGMGGRDMRSLAQAYLDEEKNRKSAHIADQTTKLLVENEELKARLAKLEAGSVGQIFLKPKGKRGRPRRDPIIHSPERSEENKAV